MSDELRIKIGGYIIGVSFSGRLIANESRIGEYSPFEQKIKLAKDLTDQQQKETLIHEILEAINDIYELGLDHDEQLCKLSAIIHQLVVDNPNLLNALRSYD